MQGARIIHVGSSDSEGAPSARVWGSAFPGAPGSQTYRRSSEPCRDRPLATSISVCSDDGPPRSRAGPAAGHVVAMKSASLDACLEEKRTMKASRNRRPSVVQTRKNMLPLKFVQTTENITTFSPDMEARIYDKICKSLGRKYGSLERANQAAATIQKAYRVVKLRRHFVEIRREGGAGAGPMSRRSSVVARERWGVASIVKQQALDFSDDVDSLADASDSAPSEYAPGSFDGQFENVYEMEAMEDSFGGGGGGGDGDGGGGGGGMKRLRRCQSMTTTRTLRVERRVEEEEEEGKEESGGSKSNEMAYWNRLVGIQLFNRKPASGIQYLISKGTLRDTPRSVAKFLKEQNGLSKMKIGEFVGEIRYEFNMAVLEHLAQSIDMKDKHIDEALREFQTLFLMPGEAQKIDKIMQIFAAEYIEANGIQFGSGEDHKQLSVLEYLTANQWEFETEDAVYVLSFSIMMLHTSLHNPSVKHRDSKEQWIKMNRGINGGGNFTKQFLLGIYDRIQKTSFVTGQDHTKKVAEIHHKLVGEGSDVLKMSTPQRCFVDELTVFELDVVNSWKKGKHKRVLLMFNDLVLVTKKNKEQYMFKRSFSLINAAAVPYQSADLPEKYGVQIYSSMHRTLLFQCCCKTQLEYERLLKNLNDSIKLLNLLEKERITASQEQPHRHANKRTLYKNTSDLISQVVEISKSTEYLPSVGNLHCSIDSSLGLKPLSASNLSVALENLHQLDDESRRNSERRHLFRSMINIRSDEQASNGSTSFDDVRGTSFEAKEPSFDGVEDVHHMECHSEPSQVMDKRPVSISAGKMDMGLYDMDKLIPCAFHPNVVSVV